MSAEKCVLGGGCFWCLEAVFKSVKGVVGVRSGYADGAIENPTYEAVCSGTTGHAEVVEIEFDNSIVNYRNLLTVFFAIHDPTTLNRQGADIGTQYRSIIMYANEAQLSEAKSVIQEISDQQVWSDPIVTEVKPLTRFYPAEDYHQDYFAKNPYTGYCHMVVAPKVAKFRKSFSHLLK